MHPIIIFQMGKVGSRTIERSLSAAFERRGLSFRLHHCHSLQDLDAKERLVAASWQNAEVILEAIRSWKVLKAEMDTHPEKVWSIVSLVREPVARSVSSFFQGLAWRFPDVEARWASGALSLQSVQRIFLTEFYGHRAPGAWFDEEMKAVFGIDVYSRPFPIRHGYGIYRDNPRAPLLLLRVENLDGVAAEAMHRFLGLKDFELIRNNIGEEKEYAALYRDFVSMPLPDAYLDEMYGGRYARHFYAEAELQGFRRRWSGELSAAPREPPQAGS